MAKTLNQLGSLLAQTNASPAVEKLHEEALTIARQEEGPVGPTIGETLVAWAKLKRDLGGSAAAERLFREGLAVERKALSPRDPRLYETRRPWERS